MKEYICTHCGYRKVNDRVEESIPDIAAFPFMTSGGGIGSLGGIVPLSGMKYMVMQEDACPICNSVDCWECID